MKIGGPGSFADQRHIEVTRQIFPLLLTAGHTNALLKLAERMIENHPDDAVHFREAAAMLCRAAEQLGQDSGFLDRAVTLLRTGRTLDPHLDLSASLFDSVRDRL